MRGATNEQAERIERRSFGTFRFGRRSIRWPSKRQTTIYEWPSAPAYAAGSSSGSIAATVLHTHTHTHRTAVAFAHRAKREKKKEDPVLPQPLYAFIIMFEYKIGRESEERKIF